jgi:hypothetical protein
MYVNVLNIHAQEALVVIAEKIDEYGKGAWIALMVLGFWFFWPVGLAILAFLSWSGRFRMWRHNGPGRWYNTGERSSGCGWRGRAGSRAGSAPPSGNRAFDEYREQTLRRLEEEQKEFVEYLERLRQAKDKAEFDAFMAERRRRTEQPEAPPDAA